MTSKLSIVEGSPLKKRRMTQAERLMEAHNANENLKRELKEVQAHADYLQLEVDHLKLQIDEDYIPLDSCQVAVGDQEVVEREDFLAIQKLEDLKVLKWHADLGSEHHKEQFERLLMEII